MSWIKVGETYGQAVYSGTNFSLPAGIAEGDIVIVAVACDFALYTNTDGVQTSGYTNIFYPNSSRPGSQVAYKIMGATPDSVVNVRANTTGNIPAAVIVQTWRGVDTTTPLDVTSVGWQGLTGSPNAGEITTVNDNCLILAVGLLDDDVVTDGSAPTGYSNFRHYASNSSTVYMASKTQTSAGNEDPGGFGGSGNDQWYAITIALRSGQTIDTVIADELTGTAPTLDTPALAQVHAVTSTAITNAAWVLDTPALEIATLVASDGLTNDAWAIETPALTQVQVLTATELTLSAAQLDAPTLGQIHVVVSSDLIFGTPALDTPFAHQIAASGDSMLQRTSLSLGLRIG